MSDVAIKIDRLTKIYRLYDDPLDRLKESLHPFRKKYHHDFYALKDVNFEIKKGETVGILGKNGAGKSTLLKILTGVLTPTHGQVSVNGRVLALLELGTGFNPELTGIENIYFNGALLGASREEMDRKLDAILQFADIGDFVHQPVKTYSSGMYVRLAFAVIANMDAEVLIVDEALSVGDELFQRKCFSRIEAIRASGATILFVSHSGATVVELCDRAVLLDEGEKIAIGTPKQILGYYQKLLYAQENTREAIREQILLADESVMSSLGTVEGETAAYHATIRRTQELQESFDPNLKPSSTIEYESNRALIESPTVLTLAGEQVNNLIRGRTYRYAYTVRFTQSANNVRFGMLIKTISGVELGGGVSANSSRESLIYAAAGSVYRVEFRFNCSLNPGVYFMNAGLVGEVDGSETYLHRLIDVYMFRVQPDDENLTTGIVDFGCYPVLELHQL